MVDWMSAVEACNFFQVDPEGLIGIITEYDIDVDVDEKGNILGVNPAELREPLFGEHEKNVGYRPDDSKVHEREKKALEEREKKERVVRESKRHRLITQAL